MKNDRNRLCLIESKKLLENAYNSNIRLRPRYSKLNVDGFRFVFFHDSDRMFYLCAPSTPFFVNKFRFHLD